MSKQDRDLIRNFGKLEEEQAEKDLMKAINADQSGGNLKKDSS